MQPSDELFLDHEIRYVVGLGRRRRLAGLVAATRSDEHGSPSLAGRPGARGRSHSAPRRPTTFPVAQAAADRQVILTDRVPEVEVHRKTTHDFCTASREFMRFKVMPFRTENSGSTYNEVVARKLQDESQNLARGKADVSDV